MPFIWGTQIHLSKLLQQKYLNKEETKKLKLYRSDVWQQCWGVEEAMLWYMVRKSNVPYTIPNVEPTPVSWMNTFEQKFLQNKYFYYKIIYHQNKTICNIMPYRQVLALRHTEAELMFLALTRSVEHIRIATPDHTKKSIESTPWMLLGAISEEECNTKANTVVFPQHWYYRDLQLHFS